MSLLPLFIILSPVFKPFFVSLHLLITLLFAGVGACASSMVPGLDWRRWPAWGGGLTSGE